MLKTTNNNDDDDNDDDVGGDDDDKEEEEEDSSRIQNQSVTFTFQDAEKSIQYTLESLFLRSHP